MATRNNRTQPSLVNKGARPSEKKIDGDGYKLHLALDKSSYARLVWLQGALRAASFGEILRRALDAYEVFDPENLADIDDTKSDRVIHSRNEEPVEHLYVVISNEMKSKLDEEKSSFGRTYKETIRRALCVLMQLVRERKKIINTIKNGDATCQKKEDDNDSNINPIILACL